MHQCPEITEVKTLRELFALENRLHSGLEVVTTRCPWTGNYVAFLRVVKDTYGLHHLDMDAPRQRSEAWLLGKAWGDHSMAPWFPYVSLGNSAGIGFTLLSDWFAHVVVKDYEIIRDWLRAIEDYTEGLESLNSMVEQMGSNFDENRVFDSRFTHCRGKFLINPDRKLRPQVGVRIQNHEPLRVWGGDVDIFKADETAEKIAYDYLAEKGFKEEVVKIAESLKGTDKCSFKVDFNFTDKDFRDEVRPHLVRWMSNIFDLTPEVFYIDTKFVGDETIEMEIFVNYDPAWEPETLKFIRSVFESVPWFSLYIPEHQDMLLKGARNSCFRRTNAHLLKGHEKDLIKAVEKDFGRVVLSPAIERRVRDGIRKHLENVEKFKALTPENQEEAISGIRGTIARFAEDMSAYRHQVITAWHGHMMERTTW